MGAILSFLNRWNRAPGPMARLSLLGWFVLLSAWFGASWALWSSGIFGGERWSDWWILDGDALVVAYLWAGLGGAIGTLLFMEINRWLFSRSVMLSWGQKPQPRKAPRFEPITAGIVERFLFTTLAVVLLAGEGHPTVLGGIMAGYVALKGFKRFEATEQA